MDRTNILEDLPRVLNSAEFVSLEGRPWMNEDRAVKSATAVSLVTAFLSSTSKLSQLTMDICFLSSNVGGVLSSPAVQQTLKNLNRLDLVRMTEFESGWGHPQDFLNSQEKDTFWRNFGFLTGLPNRLKRFKLTPSTPIEQRNDNILNFFLRRLLMNNKATLEKLELHLKVWWINEPETLTFPALKSLTAYVEWGGDTLGEFLRNQRSLEELTLTSWLVHGDYLNLYTGIKECSVGLKKLHLTGRNFAQFDWSFLAAMNRLTDFRLRMSGGLEKGGSLLASLPKNQLDCLSLEGLFKSNRPFGFWGLCGVENEFHYKKELLEGFRCLRKLSFLGSWDAVDDQLMQWLLKEFVLLEEFQLSDCSTLTDAGISGKTTAEWGRGVSFANLRRLKTLLIVKCRGVTPYGVLASCVNVPSLRSLEYTNPRGQIVESVVMKLVEQNRRLEKLSLAYAGDVGDFGKLKAKVMKKYPRVELSLAKEEDDE